MSERNVPLTADVADVLPIIKRFLYAEREVFIRELVSNALDALEKLTKLATSGDEHKAVHADVLRVDVAVDLVASAITVTDNGIGMNSDEVARYINQIAFSGARDFLRQHPTDDTQLIGRFGLGFYSSFMVSRVVEIDTFSWIAGAGGAHWSCDGGPTAVMGSPRRTERGTTVTCRLNDDAREFLDIDLVERVVRRYFNYARHPIYLSGRQVNTGEAPWHLGVAERQLLPRERYWACYEQLHADENRPLAWVHIDSDFPVQSRGLLFVPDRGDKDGAIQLFANRTFVCGDAPDLLPEWLGFFDGAVESGDLPLNVARDKFQRDHRVAQLRNHLTTKVVAFLSDAQSRRPADFLRIWERFGDRLKIGYLETALHGQGVLAEKLEKLLLFPSSRKPLTTVADYIARCAPDSTILYATDRDGQHAHVELLRNRNREVLWLTDRIDPLIVRALGAAHPEWSLARVDQIGVTDRPVTKPAQETEGSTPQDWSDLINLFREIAGDRLAAVEVEALPSLEIPAILNVTERAALTDDFTRLTGADSGDTSPQQLVLNTNSALIRSLGSLGPRLRGTPLATAIVGQVWDNVRLNAHQLEGDQFSAAIQRHREFLLLVALDSVAPLNA